MNNKKRIEEIDILKALGIICMVAGHSGAPFTKFIYLFHMAIFFIASGFFFKDSASDSFKGCFLSIKAIFKRLWFTFFIWTAIYILLNNLFINMNVYTNNMAIHNYLKGPYIGTHEYMTISQMFKEILKAFFFGGSTTIGGAFWFLKVLFLVSVGYVIIDYLIKLIFRKSNNLLIQAIVSILLLVFGYFCSIKEIRLFGIEKMLSFYCLYYIGHLLSLYKDKYSNFEKKIQMLILISSFGILLILNNLGDIELNKNSYVNPLFLLVTSLVGWCFLYSISYFIKHTKFKYFMISIGKRTLSVIILHFLCMKVVAYMVCSIYSLPLYCVAAHPNVYGNVGLWWLAYTVVGTLMPVGLCIIYEKIKKIIFKPRQITV